MITRQSRVGALILLAVISVAAPAHADGAISLALATFDWGPWFAYVVVTILFEAAVLGWWLRVSSARALWCSLQSNFVTAVLGGFVSGILCAFIGFYGTQLNPDPFGRTILLFTLFGFGSALIESGFWWRAVLRGKGTEPSGKQGSVPNGRRVVFASVVTHLIGVPVALAILLIPARPYPGLEAQVWAERSIWLGRGFEMAPSAYLSSDGSLPVAHSYEDFLKQVQPKLPSRYARDPSLWAAAYVPDYHRFDRKEMRRVPLEWNPKASGFNSIENDQEGMWIARSDYSPPGSPNLRWYAGLIVDFGGYIRETSDPTKLGYNAK